MSDLASYVYTYMNMKLKNLLYQTVQMHMNMKFKDSDFHGHRPAVYINQHVLWNLMSADFGALALISNLGQ